MERNGRLLFGCGTSRGSELGIFDLGGGS